jgi:hypothetical protein
VTTKGKKVKASEAALLKKLNFKPFEYGMKVVSVYDDGSILPEAVLNLDPTALLSKFEAGSRNIIGLSLTAGYPISATIPLLITNAFKNLAALSIESGYFIANADSRSRKSKLLPRAALLPPLPRRPRRKRRRKPPRRKPLPLLLPLLRRKRWTWAICSADRI